MTAEQVAAAELVGRRQQTTANSETAEEFVKCDFQNIQRNSSLFLPYPAQFRSASNQSSSSLEYSKHFAAMLRWKGVRPVNDKLE